MNHCQSKQTKTHKEKELWPRSLQKANVPPIGDGSVVPEPPPRVSSSVACPAAQPEPRAPLGIALLVRAGAAVIETQELSSKCEIRNRVLKLCKEWSDSLSVIKIKEFHSLLTEFSAADCETRNTLCEAEVFCYV